MRGDVGLASLRFRGLSQRWYPSAPRLGVAARGQPMDRLSANGETTR